MALEAGADKIYGIEAFDKAFQKAKKKVKKREWSESIKLKEGFSTDVSLDEKGDVFLQELIGSIGSREGLVKVKEDAKERLLAEDPTFIPEEVTTFLAPVEPLPMSGFDKIMNKLLLPKKS